MPQMLNHSWFAGTKLLPLTVEPLSINFPRDNSRHIRTDDVEMSLTCQAGSRHCSADSRRQTDRHERPWKNSSI